MAKPQNPSLTWIQCEQAIEEIHNPNEAEPTGIQQISAWLWLNHKLYERAKKEWRSYSCAPPFGCSCTAASGEYRMHNLFELLQKITELYQKEPFFKGIVERFSLIENNRDEIRKWLDNNFDRAVNTTSLLGMDFWDEDLDFNKSSYSLKSITYSEYGISVKCEEFSNALKFLGLYHVAYSKHELCPA